MWKTINKKLILIAAASFLFSCKKEVQQQEIQKNQDTIQVQKESDSVAVNPKKPEAKTEYKKFKGAWYELEYPSDFTPKNSQLSSTMVDAYESAMFTSPDGKVQFYVFSPQWSGVARDIAIDLDKEEQAEISHEQKDGWLIKRWTLKAKDGSYSRSYEEKSATESHTNSIFGIKYASQKDLEKYREEYLYFKNSLEQYAD